jgi:hypothetical protein
MSLSVLLKEIGYGETAVLAKSRVVILASWCLMQSVNAADGSKPHLIKVLIRPECKAMFYGPDFIDLDVHGKTIPTKKKARPDYVEWDASVATPLSFRDPNTSTVFYVESDGRHLAAIGSDGKILWIRNPFEDRHLCPYRTPWPTIVHIESTESNKHMAAISNWHGDKNHGLLSVQFSGSQFGVVDQVTGDYFPEGQN